MRKLFFALILGILVINLASAVTIQNIAINPEEIIPGERAFVNIVLRNNDNDDAENIQVSIDIKEFPFKTVSSPESSIDVLKDGREQSVSFNIEALSNAQAGIYKIPLRIIYENEQDREFEKESILSLIVKSPIILEAEIEEGLILKGQENEISVRIINKGVSDAKFLDIKLRDSSHYDIISQSDAYIGDVDSDDFESTEFSVFIKDDAPGKIIFPVELRYKDVLNNEFQQQDPIPVSLYSRQEAVQLGLIQSSNSAVIIYAIVIVVLVYVLYRILKKRKKKDLSKK
jgi:hypothetical protein